MLKKLIMATRRVRYAWDSITYPEAEQSRLLASLRDTCRGRAMLVVGNGPSLNDTPLDQFAGVPSIGMNKIDLIYQRTTWRPTAVVCVNNLVARQHQDAWVAASVPVLLSWKCRHFIRRTLRSRFRYFLSLASSDFSTNVVEGVGASATVTYSALQLAYFMGADPVILIGVDHSFAGAHEGRENEIERRVGSDQDHFDPNYFAEGQLWGIPDLSASEDEYARARRAFESDGRRIYDATVGGKLRVFERISLEEALTLTTETT